MTGLVDPFGAVLTLIRDDAAVTAIVGQKVASQVVGNEQPPLIVLVENSTTTRPYGPGSGRLGMQGVTYVARCYGADTPTGAIQARQLAGAVVSALNNRHWTKVGTKLLAEAYTPELEGITRDPVTRWPHVDVRIDINAMAEAVA